MPIKLIRDSKFECWLSPIMRVSMSQGRSNVHSWLISNDITQQEMVLHSLIANNFIMITCISYELWKYIYYTSTKID